MSTTMTSREFNQRTHAAKLAARHGPVVVTDRGVPQHVLLTYDAYQRLRGTRTLADLVGHDRTAAGTELPEIGPSDLAQPADLD